MGKDHLLRKQIVLTALRSTGNEASIPASSRLRFFFFKADDPKLLRKNRGLKKIPIFS